MPSHPRPPVGVDGWAPDYETEYLSKLVTICTVFCGSGAFRCSNGTCIRSFRQCDGTVDCIDDSDEIGCGSKLSRNLETKG